MTINNNANARQYVVTNIGKQHFGPSKYGQILIVCGYPLTKEQITQNFNIHSGVNANIQFDEETIIQFNDIMYTLDTYLQELITRGWLITTS
jgi:hypothetical protein